MAELFSLPWLASAAFLLAAVVTIVGIETRDDIGSLFGGLSRRGVERPTPGPIVYRLSRALLGLRILARNRRRPF